MNRLIAVLIALGFFMVMALPAAGAWNAEDVAGIKKKLQEGKGLNESGAYSSDGVQVIEFRLGRTTSYLVDFKARLCMLIFRESATLVPCSRLKKGYPLFAPLITWED